MTAALPSWTDVASRARWRALLLGNGMSTHVWPGFSYATLHRTATRNGDLSPQDQALFAELRTENFEHVLGHLSAALRIGGALALDTDALARRHRSIQAALGAAVRGVHVRRGAVGDATLVAIKDTILAHEAVFTTNYDLLIYWGMSHADRYGRLVDLFWSTGAHGPCSFDPDNARPTPGRTTLYYLHGALHLVVRGDGTTQKRRRTDARSILAQFGTPLAGDPDARPLLITEGTAAEKRRAIEANAYLAHALGRLHACALPLVLFGSALGPGDQHLVDAINAHPERPVAVSMRPTHGTAQTLARQRELRARLHARELHFYDATTHPLGTPVVATRRAAA